MSKTETTNEAPRIDPHRYEIGNAMELKAQETAAKCEFLMPTINTIVKARQDYEGGPFAVYFKVIEKMTPEQIQELPDPNVDSGNNPGIYWLRSLNSKGKPVVKERHYYKVLSDRIPGNVAKQQRIDMLELSTKDPVQYNLSSVPQDIRDMKKEQRKAEISKLEGELSTSRTNIVAAFDLAFRISATNDLPGVICSPLYAVNAKGQLLNGEDDRPMVIENTREPIIITTTVEGRKAVDTTRLSIASFKKLRPAVAKEHHGTYQALIDSPIPAAKRGTKAAEEPGGSKPERIATNDTLIARLVDVHAYMDEIASDTKQTNYSALLGSLNKKEGSADLLLTVTEVRDFLTGLLNKTYKAGERYQELTVQRAEALAKVA